MLRGENMATTKYIFMVILCISMSALITPVSAQEDNLIPDINQVIQKLERSYNKIIALKCTAQYDNFKKNGTVFFTWDFDMTYTPPGYLEVRLMEPSGRLSEVIFVYDNGRFGVKLGKYWPTLKFNPNKLDDIYFGEGGLEVGFELLATFVKFMDNPRSFLRHNVEKSAISVDEEGHSRKSKQTSIVCQIEKNRWLEFSFHQKDLIPLTIKKTDKSGKVLEKVKLAKMKFKFR